MLGNGLRLEQRIQDYLNFLHNYVLHKLLDFQTVDCRGIPFSTVKRKKKKNKKPLLTLFLLLKLDDNYLSQDSEKLNVLYILNSGICVYRCY